MIEKKTVLIVIAGPNGSGKTSITKKILHHEWMEDATYINPDIIAQLLFRITDGKLAKQYTPTIPLWAKQIYNASINKG